jgi:prenyltransferase beta subunit
LSARRAIAIFACAQVAIALGGVPAAAKRVPERRAVDWLVSQQVSTGAFGAADAPADQVAEVVASLVAARVQETPVRAALDHIARTGPERAAQQPAFAGRIAMGVSAAGGDPRAFAGTDYVALALAAYDPVTGTHDGAGLYANALAVLGAVAGGEAIPTASVRYLRTHECAGGGWGHARACLSDPDVDTTALSLTVLAHAGASDDAMVARALSFLRGAQNADGGFGLAPGTPTNANSTGLALSALAVLDLEAQAWRRLEGSPQQALMSLQRAGGGFAYDGASPEAQIYATVQALPGLVGAGYPVAHRPFLSEARARAWPEPVTSGRASAARVAPAGTHAETQATGSVAGAVAAAAAQPAGPVPARSRAMPIAGALATLAIASMGLALHRRRS